MEETIIKNCIGFEWDIFNETKNWEKHAVTKWECEQVFFNKPLLCYEDIKHSQKENRMYILGQTDENRKLFVVFTVRNKQIRVISARSMSKKERAFYEQI
jgi:uncharacterized DUF497 family protein